MQPDIQLRQQQMLSQGLFGTRTVDDYFRALVARLGEREAVVDASNRDEFLGGVPRRLSFKQLDEEVQRTCQLLSRQGLAHGDVVCVQLPNCVEQFSIYLACARMGLVAMPVPIQYREHELAYILRTANARAAVTYRTPLTGGHDHVHMFQALQATVPSLNLIVALNGATAAWEVVAATPPNQNPKVQQPNANDVFTICWTSGTEARPKGVPRTHNEWFALGRVAIGLSRVAEDERILNPFPLINMAGFATGFFTWLMTGCTVVQHHPFKLPVFLAQLRDERIDHTVAPPTLLNAMLQNPDMLKGIDFGRLKRIGSGAAPLSPWMVSEFDKRWGVAILNNYGSNEGGVIAGSELDVSDATLRATCFPRSGVNGLRWKSDGLDTVLTRLVDPETEAEIDQPGVPGELRFAGPTMFSGYIGEAALTERAFDAKGYYRSGDMFEIAGDQHQFYRYVGRLKDIVIRGGMNISAEEIDALLLSHPKIADAAAVGYPDASLGERVCAFVILRPGEAISLDELTRFLLDEKKVAIYKLPERLEVVSELPRNPVGKLLKRDLRQALRERMQEASTA